MQLIKPAIVCKIEPLLPVSNVIYLADLMYFKILLYIHICMCVLLFIIFYLVHTRV